MLRKNNYNISIEFLNCLKNNDAMLGLYNANENVKQNNGSMKYKHEQKKGTKVMFTFKLRACDELEQSPSIFTDRSLLNNFNRSENFSGRAKDKNIDLMDQRSDFGMENAKDGTDDLFGKIEQANLVKNYKS